MMTNESLNRNEDSFRSSSVHESVDAAERRRQRSRVAQRKYRRNVKQKLQLLESLEEGQLITLAAFSSATDMSAYFPAANQAMISISPERAGDINTHIEPENTIDLAMPSLFTPPSESIDYTVSSTNHDTPDYSISAENGYHHDGTSEIASLDSRNLIKGLPDSCPPRRMIRPTEMNALHRAVCLGSEPIVQLLIDRGADVTARDGRGQTALHIAAENGYHRIVKLLLERGIDCNIRNMMERTALHEAVEHGHENVIAQLLDTMTDINRKDALGETALHVAVESESLSTILTLLDRGADVNA